MAQYIIRAALREEVNDGWVWVDGFQSRTVIKIENLDTKCSVICQARKLDDNFVKHYNDVGSGRYTIGIGCNMIVMSDWYREILDICGTTASDNETATLTVCRYGCWEWWGDLRAASHHPDIVVRLGTRLGVLGAGLGLVGAVLGLLSLVQADGCFKWLSFGIGSGILALSAGFLSWCCCGPKRPQKT